MVMEIVSAGAPRWKGCTRETRVPRKCRRTALLQPEPELCIDLKGAMILLEIPAQHPYRRLEASVTTNSTLRTEKQSSPENTRCAVRPSALIHLGGKLLVSPGPTSHFSV